MSRSEPEPGEEGPGEVLDAADWPSFRRTAHRVLDELVDYLGDVRNRPVWRPAPDDVKHRVGTPPAAPWRRDRRAR